MQVELLDEAVLVMEEVKAKNKLFDMAYWGCGVSDPASREEPVCRMCGCFGGWLAWEPKFQARGLALQYYESASEAWVDWRPEVTKSPDLRLTTRVAEGFTTVAEGYYALARLFDITYGEAEWLASPAHYDFDDRDSPDAVVVRLKRLKSWAGLPDDERFRLRLQQYPNERRW